MVEKCQEKRLMSSIAVKDATSITVEKTVFLILENMLIPARRIRTATAALIPLKAWAMSSTSKKRSKYKEMR